MTNKGDTGPGGWEAARRRAKANYARKMALGRHWKTRWKEQPELMRANLDRLNAAKKERAKEITKLLAKLAEKLQPEIPSWHLRQSLKYAIISQGGDPSKKTVHKVLMAMRRRGMLTYIPDRLTWTVAYPRLDDNVGS